MATASATPFSAEAQQQVAQQASPEKSKMDLANGKSFKLVASPRYDEVTRRFNAACPLLRRRIIYSIQP